MKYVNDALVYVLIKKTVCNFTVFSVSVSDLFPLMHLAFFPERNMRLDLLNLMYVSNVSFSPLDDCTETTAMHLLHSTMAFKGLIRSTHHTITDNNNIKRYVSMLLKITKSSNRSLKQLVSKHYI